MVRGLLLGRPPQFQTPPSRVPPRPPRQPRPASAPRSLGPASPKGSLGSACALAARAPNAVSRSVLPSAYLSRTQLATGSPVVPQAPQTRRVQEEVLPAPPPAAPGPCLAPRLQSHPAVSVVPSFLHPLGLPGAVPPKSITGLLLSSCHVHLPKSSPTVGFLYPNARAACSSSEAALSEGGRRVPAVGA